MAKPTKQVGAEAPAAPAAPAAPKAPKVEKIERFKFVPEGKRTKEQLALKKLPPQATCIVQVIEKAGAKGLLRAELVNNLKGVLTTKQPEGRILSYYQKDLVDAGYVTLVEEAA